MIKFRCSSCQQKLGVPDEYAGRRVKCNKCGQPAIVAHPVVLEEVPPKPKPVTEPDGMDIFSDLEGFADTQDDARQEAIRMARQERTAKSAKGAVDSLKSKKEKKTKTPGKSPSQRTPIADMLPDVLRLPIALLASLIAVAATIAIWIASARATGDPLCFVALLVPLIGALTLRTLTVNHTLVLALLGLVIGIAGILGGKAAIAKYVIIGLEVEKANEEFLVDLDATLADEKLQYGRRHNTATLVMGNDFTFYAAIISLVDEGLMDPIKARKLAISTLRSTNQSNAFVFFTEGAGDYKSPENEEEYTEIVSQVISRAFQWKSEKLGPRYTKKYQPAINKLIQQAEALRILEDPEKVFQYALIKSLGVFDYLWIMLGMAIGFGVVIFD